MNSNIFFRNWAHSSFKIILGTTFSKLELFCFNNCFVSPQYSRKLGYLDLKSPNPRKNHSVFLWKLEEQSSFEAQQACFEKYLSCNNCPVRSKWSFRTLQFLRTLFLQKSRNKLEACHTVHSLLESDADCTDNSVSGVVWVRLSKTHIDSRSQ